jgi:hypothetical protein
LLSTAGQLITTVPCKKGQRSYTISKTGLSSGLYWLIAQNEMEVIARQAFLVQ